MTNLNKTIHEKNLRNPSHLVIWVMAILCLVALMPLLSHATDAQDTTQEQTDTEAVTEEETDSATVADSSSNEANDSKSEHKNAINDENNTKSSEAEASSTKEETQDLTSANTLQNVAIPTNSNGELTSAIDLSEYPSTYLDMGITCSSSDHTITFNSVDLTFASSVMSTSGSYCILLPDDDTNTINLSLIGENKITVAEGTNSTSLENPPSIIYGRSSLAIASGEGKGTGVNPSLTINSSMTFTDSEDGSYCIYTPNSTTLTITGCDVAISDSYSGTSSAITGIYTPAATIDGSSTLDIDIKPMDDSSNNLNIFGIVGKCTVDQSSLDIDISCGADFGKDKGAGAICVNGTLSTGTNGAKKINLNAYGSNIQSKCMNILGGIKSVLKSTNDSCTISTEDGCYINSTVSGSATAYGAYSEVAISFSGNVQISATAGDSGNAYGTYVKGKSSELNFSYGTVEINATTGEYSSSSNKGATGIVCTILNVSSEVENLNVSATSAENCKTFGIYAGTINIYDSDQVNVESSVLGVYAEERLTFNANSGTASGILDIKTNKLSTIKSLTQYPPTAFVTMSELTGTNNVGYKGYADTVDQKSFTYDDDPYYYLESANYSNTCTDDDESNTNYTMAYQVRISALPNASVTTSPTATTPTYSGSTQAIASAGTVSNGTIYYMVSEEQPSKDDTGWSKTIPSETAAGSYNLWYYVDGSSGYNDVEVCESPIVCTIAKANSTVDTTPAAKTLTYTGEGQALATVGSCTGGTMYYIVNDTKPSIESNAEWSTTIPTATDAGTYNLWYYVAGDSNHNNVDVCSTAIACTIAKAESIVDTEPAAKTLTYTGEAQALATEGTCTGGTMYYMVSDTEPSKDEDATWSTTMPTATDAGTYKLWYYVAGDSNHNDVDVCSDPVECTINAKVDPTPDPTPTPTPDNSSNASTSSSEIAQTADSQDLFAVIAGSLMQLF